MPEQNAPSTAPAVAPAAPPTTKHRLIDAGGVLATSIAVALQQTGRLGAAPFSLQVTATVAGLSAAPALHRSNALNGLPGAPRALLLLGWGALAAAPTAVALLVELMTGHRRPGSGWLAAVWRIYAILALWIAFAVANERVIRPWWRDASARWFAGSRASSVAAQARHRALDRRATVLEGIKARVVIALRRKERAGRLLGRREAEVADAELAVRTAADLLEKARRRAEQLPEGGDGDGAQQEAADVVEKRTETLETAKLQARAVKVDIDRCKVDIEAVEDDIKMLQHEWTNALHIDNHTEFMR